MRQGDLAAFEAMFRSYYTPLCRYARTYARSAADAEDVVQEVFAQIWTRRSEWVLRGSLASYLYGAVRHRTANQRRRHAVTLRWERQAVIEARITDSNGLCPATAPPADAVTDERELAVAVGRGVAALPDRCREAFLLRRQHGLSYAEIAVVMDIAPKTVAIHIGVALKTLRRTLAAWVE